MLPEAKQVMSSRSLGARVNNLNDLEDAISYHCTMAGKRMRKKGLYTQMVYVFIQNNPYDESEYYAASRPIGLPVPTNSTIKIANAAL